MISTLRDLIIGIAVGDAVGVPVEFTSRSTLKANPVTDMMAYGTHHQPKGTWSDDTAMALCYIASVRENGGINHLDIAKKFQQWYRNGYMTPHGVCFDIGGATAAAIHRFEKNVLLPELCGGTAVGDNGNGSLMRILPIVFDIYDLPIWQRYEEVRKLSSITHAHIRSVISCFYLTEYAIKILKGVKTLVAYHETSSELAKYLRGLEIADNELAHFDRILNYEAKPLYSLTGDEIHGSGYCVHTLEAALWCLMTTENYSDCVLKAVNLGDDTDTTAAVAGGLAGIYYGHDSIRMSWINSLARLQLLLDLTS